MNTKPHILGGPKTRSKPLSGRHAFGTEEQAAVSQVLDSGCLSGFIGAKGSLFNGGPYIQKFEAECSEYFGYKHCITVNSWTTGLMACAGAIGISPGDEVICPPYTMSASATAVLFYGGIPVFADIDPIHCCIDPASIESKITERTKAIVAVHLFGYPCDLDAIQAIATKHNLKVIEDAAQAPGTKYQGKHVGGLIDIGGFSLNFHKHINTGEGGIIVTNNDEMAERCRLIRNHGENVLDDYPYEDLSNLIGSNYRLTELQAAIGSEQLKKLDLILEKRRTRAQILMDCLDELPGLSYPKLPDQAEHSYYTFPIIYDSAVNKIPRTRFIKALQAEMPEPEDWETTIVGQGYIKPLYWGRQYREKLGLGKMNFPFNLAPSIEYKKGDCPNCETLFLKTLITTDMVRDWAERDEMKDFARAIQKVYAHQSEIQQQFGSELEEAGFQLPHETIDALENAKNTK